MRTYFKIKSTLDFSPAQTKSVVLTEHVNPSSSQVFGHTEVSLYHNQILQITGKSSPQFLPAQRSTIPYGLLGFPAYYLLCFYFRSWQCGALFHIKAVKHTQRNLCQPLWTPVCKLTDYQGSAHREWPSFPKVRRMSHWFAFELLCHWNTRMLQNNTSVKPAHTFSSIFFK